LNGITINSQNFRPTKKHVELLFTILSKEEAEKKKNTTPKAKGKAAPKKANEFFDKLTEQKVEVCFNQYVLSSICLFVRH
jgi:hypothetical protein